MTQSSTQLRFRDLLLCSVFTNRVRVRGRLHSRPTHFPGNKHLPRPATLAASNRGVGSPHRSTTSGRAPPRGRLRPGDPPEGRPRPRPPRTMRPWAPPQSALVRLSSRGWRPPTRAAASCALGRSRKDLESQGPNSGHLVESRQRSKSPIRKSARRPTGLTNLKPSAGSPGGPAEPPPCRSRCAPGVWTPRADPKDAAPEAEGVAKKRRFQAAGSAPLPHPEPPTR